MTDNTQHALYSETPIFLDSSSLFGTVLYAEGRPGNKLHGIFGICRIIKE